MENTKIEKCAHPGCNCPVQPGKKHCSDYCESLGDEPSIACECHHATCTSSALAGTAG